MTIRQTPPRPAGRVLPPQKPETPSYLKGTNTLLYGDVGSGKTSTLPTWIAAGLEFDVELKLAVIMTEPGAVETLLDGMILHAPKGMDTLPMDRLHYCEVLPTSGDFHGMMEMAKKVNMMGYKDLADLKHGLAKDKHKQFYELLSMMNNFINQHGTSLGPITKFDNTWMVAVDSLTGVNWLARQQTVGLKPAPHQGEWGVMMGMEAAIINSLVGATECFICLTGHVAKEVDEVVGKPQYMPMFLGQKLAPDVPKIFSDIALQVRDETDFFWSTIRKDYNSLKARNLILADNLPPSFAPIYKRWLERKNLAEQAAKAEEQGKVQS